MSAYFVCTRCGEKFATDVPRWRCNCGGTLNLVGYDFAITNATIAGLGIWRWLHDLPVANDAIVTMGEGDTPLVCREINNVPAYFKLDFVNPTGSYKDRGMSTLVSWLKSVGINQVIEDSSGNAGSSMAAYCAAGNIACDVYVPAYTSEGKCVQIQAYGANLVRVPGTREDTTRAAITTASQNNTDNTAAKFYASHNWNPFFLHGVKTWVFEVIEQLAPILSESGESEDCTGCANCKNCTGNTERDRILNLVVPVGQGSIALGAKIALDDLESTGVLSALNLRVKIWAVQPENCAPLARAAELNLFAPIKIDKLDTAAEGIASAEPVRGAEVLASVRATHKCSCACGCNHDCEHCDRDCESCDKRETGFVTVSESDIWSALDMLCRAGLYVEPTSAAAAAGWIKLVQSGRIHYEPDAPDAREITVVYLSGSGLKATDKILKHRTSPNP